MNTHIQVVGYFTPSVYTYTNGVRVLKDSIPTFKNLITDSGLDFLGNGRGYFRGCFIGDGKSPALPSNTHLESTVGLSTNIIESYGESSSYGWGFVSRTVTYKFEQGLVGTISELGIGMPEGDLFCRTSTGKEGGYFVLSAEDEVEITYECKLFINISTLQGSIDFGEEGEFSRSYTWNSAPYNLDNNLPLYFESLTSENNNIFSWVFDPTNIEETAYQNFTDIDPGPCRYFGIHSKSFKYINKGTGVSLVPINVNDTGYLPGTYIAIRRLLIPEALGNFLKPLVGYYADGTQTVTLLGGIGTIITPMSIGSWKIYFHSRKLPKQETQELFIEYSITWGREYV